VHFGIFFELSTPRPFTRAVERQVWHNALEQARLADELGFDYVWAVEHHFLEEYSHSSAPEVFLAAVAAQTSHIRVGHGAVVCVPEMNHPIRVAERAAALDIVSDGRLELGTARSSTWTELGGFRVDPDDTKKTWDEYVRVLPRLWMEETVSHEGFSFSMPERSVLPKPLQDPHPPLWVTVTSPGTELDAADRGIGCLGVAAAGYTEQERRTREYHRRVQLCDPVSPMVNDRVTTLNFMHCHEDGAVGASTGMAMVQQFGLANAHLLWTREAYPTTAYQSLGNLAPAASGGSGGGGGSGSPAQRHGVPEGILVGDPDMIGDAVQRWESVGVDGVNMLVNAMEVVDQTAVLDSMRLFAREVMPRFRPPGWRPGASTLDHVRGLRSPANAGVPAAVDAGDGS
jgi:alkanesulfonate monooxygenase SsuD/methylene tetrahydromethanopterin reductase-like flavin-dependent oxidoreductase (luciferase family)